MKIKWLGTASLLVSYKDVTILFDPYIRHINTISKLCLDELSQVNAIFITHPHLDHFDGIDQIIKLCNVKVYVSEGGVSIAKRLGYNTENMITLKPGACHKYGDAYIKVYESSHCRFDMRIIAKTFVRTCNLSMIKSGIELLNKNRVFKIRKNDVYAFELSCEGKSIFILGSANLRDDVVYPMNSDLLVFPYQGRYDMARYSMRFIDRLGPKCIMLDHFDDAFPPISHRTDSSPFIKDVRKTHPQCKVFEPEENRWYEF